MIIQAILISHEFDRNLSLFSNDLSFRENFNNIKKE